MQRLGFLLLMFVCVFPSSLLAGAPDSALKAALYDIERAEKQSVGLTSKGKAKIRRIEGMVADAEKRLEESTSKDELAWKDAKIRLDDLKAHLASVTGGGEAASSPAPVTPSSSGAGVPSTAKPAPKGPPPLSQYDVAQLGTTDRQTESLIKQVQQVDPVDFSLPQEQDRWRGHVARMKDLYLKISQPKHPQALPVAQKITALEIYVEDQIKKATAAHAQLGDVKGRYDDIEQRTRTKKIPHPPDMPISKKQALDYAKVLKALGEEAAADHAYLESIKGKTKVVYESQIDDLLHQTNRRQKTEIPRNNKILVKRLDDRLAGIDQVPGQVAKADTNNQNHMSQAPRWTKELQEGIEYAEIAMAYEKTMGMDVIDRTGKKAVYEETLGLIGGKSEVGLQAVRFPKVRSTNPELLKAAQKVLSNPSYKINPIERMEITYDKQTKSSSEGDVEFGAAQTNVTVTRYKWDEFAVTTAEKVGDKYFLFSNLMKYFHEGGSDVPTGKWTLGKRHQGSQILKENIHQ